MKRLGVAALILVGVAVGSVHADVLTVPLNDTNAADNFLYNNDPTANFAPNLLYYYDERGGSLDKARPLIRFSLATLPPCATINSVQLQLWVQDYNFFDANNSNAVVPWEFAAHQILVDWTETGSNWLQRSAGNPWSTPGMASGTDYVAAPTATTTLNISSWTSGTYAAWDITALYTAWANGTAPNYGVYIHGPTGNPALTGPSGDTTDGYVSLLGSEYANDARRPHLVIDYTPAPDGCIACCLASGTCQTLSSAACGTAGGTSQGAGSVCSPSPCVAATGACCSGAACSVTAAASCTGTFKGAGTTCNFAGNPVTCCRANFNQVGGVTVQDIFDFLAAYFSNAATADINGVGGVTVQDIFDFLALYFAGCA
jgi:hypothetical protein